MTFSIHGVSHTTTAELVVLDPDEITTSGQFGCIREFFMAMVGMDSIGCAEK